MLFGVPPPLFLGSPVPHVELLTCSLFTVPTPGCKDLVAIFAQVGHFPSLRDTFPFN